ncbi:MAG: hypothetical protein IPH07_40100 [Deltaproteobacteria bacterium]|nr:hypothetical protein [Deltaproteobacteria bacterium]MBP7285714.1 hypothetical protein [Nannocystaceae bacterium]
MNVMEALATTLADALRDDTRRVLLGEDVTTGGMLGLSRRCADDPELRPRLLSLPLLPATAAAHAGGLALAGLRPIVLLGGVAPLLEGLAGLRELALGALRSNGERAAPVLFVAPCGPGFGTGADALDAPETALLHTAGLRVVVVGRAHEAVAMLQAAADFEAGEEPTVLLVPRMLLATVLDDEAASPLSRPFGAPAVVRDGTHDAQRVVVFTWGECVDVSLAACDAAEIDARVIDIGTLQPLALDTLVEAARDAGRIAIVHAGPRHHGAGAELAATFADRAIHYLDAPILRVCGDEGVLSGTRELLAIPSIERVGAALQTLASP